jgi:serine protease Do
MTPISHAAPLRTLLATAALGLALTGAPVPAQAQGQDFPAPQNFAEMVEAQLPAVVGILSTAPAPEMPASPMPQLPPGLGDFFGLPAPQAPQSGPMQAQGSGFFISADGYAVTNNHVIAGSERIEIVLEDDRRFDAELVGTDPATDIALLKVDTDEDLPFVPFGESDELQIGEWVVAIGNPFGLGGTVTAGIVSARSRNINSGPYDDFLQTDAAINRGNSGGPLFNVSGEVVGVNTAIFSPTGGSVGIGFAVPSRVAQRIVDDLRDDGMVERGWLGVQIQPVTDDLAAALGLEQAAGAMIAAITPGSPAAEAGLRPGDVVTQFSRAEVERPRDLSFGVAEIAVGTEASITVWRDGETQELSVEIGRQPSSMTPAAAPAGPEDEPETPRLGVSAVPLSPELRLQLNIPEDVNGLALSAVAPDSPAAEAGLRQGDVIVAASGEDTPDIAALRGAIADADEAGSPLLLRIWRGGSYSFIAVSMAEG